MLLAVLVPESATRQQHIQRFKTFEAKLKSEVKYYPQDWDEAKLMEFFGQCGPVTAAAVKIDDKGRKFAFVP